MISGLRNAIKSPRLLRNTPPAVEQRAELIAGKNIVYTLKRSSRRRSIGLRIDDRGLTVCVPLRASEKWLRSVLHEKADWVVEKLECWSARKPVESSWVSGEPIPYKGERLTLRVNQGLFATPPVRLGNALHVFVVAGCTNVHIKQAVLHWYRCEAEKLFSDRAAHFAGLLGVAPRSIKLSTAKTQWGSCTPQGSVLLSIGLIKLPPRLIDYVIAHELSHLREMNHSPAFWRVVESICSDHAFQRKALRAFSPCIDMLP